MATEGLAEEVVLVPGQGTSKYKGPEAARAQHTCHLQEGRASNLLSSSSLWRLLQWTS